MKQLYYNRWQYSDAKRDYRTDIFRCKGLIEEYLKDYPTDYAAHTFYSFLLTIINMPDQAERLLEKIEQTALFDLQFMKHDDKVRMLKEDIANNKARVLACLERYEELLYYYQKNKERIYNPKFEIIPTFCRCKLGKLNKKESEKIHHSFLYSQVLEYDEERFKEHIKKHLTDFNEDENKVISTFSENFPIDEVIEEAKKYLPSDKKFCFDLFTDSYFFKYNDCGRNYSSITDYFKIVTLHNSDQLITMCPVKLNESMPHVDLNYLNKDKGKVKTLSQIEKFNRRYRR